MVRRLSPWCRPGRIRSTNGLIAGANLICVGVTRQAEQALPVSGGFVGNADDPTGLQVDVLGPGRTDILSAYWDHLTSNKSNGGAFGAIA